ncbi:hypothetical protein [Methanobacterium ferruginis]|uniref:hypothetical protein n=1 Tax=Methanobacterium ferruginis TaxID=710191 RepID=UPI002572B352|nr:hypothetical protein [Methanobacterium ferruginis]BDZ67442.1 hypothetical protein GCM10025860_08900 [Methanobacterium ferruginis]
MTKKDDKLKVNANSCGCLIDDLLVDKPDKGDDRLCSARDSDMEFFVDPDAEKVSHDFYQRRLTDGLPIIPPTRERVNRFLDFSVYEAEDVLGILPLRWVRLPLKRLPLTRLWPGAYPNSNQLWSRL